METDFGINLATQLRLTREDWAKLPFDDKLAMSRQYFKFRYPVTHAVISGIRWLGVTLGLRKEGR
jgi:hypothetical protein